MTIKFICPQGHKVICPDDKAGQSGKCPKCGTKFMVPNPNGRTEPGPAEDLIIFLCPNGHKLNGPASLQGRPGQCPHCHAKFVIPDYSELEGDADEPSYENGGLAAPDGGIAEDQELDWQLSEESAEADVPADNRGAGRSAFSLDGQDENPSIGAHPMAVAFERLWEERRDGAIIEVQLKDGTKIIPDRYAVASSQQDLGVFAMKESDGSYITSAVAWDAVARVSARRLKHLPRDMFG